jgi:hypothetical protein
MPLGRDRSHPRRPRRRPRWKDAQTIDFIVPWRKDAPTPRGPAPARSSSGTASTFISSRRWRTRPLRNHQEHNGKLWENDVFELFFKPAAAKPGYYEFQVNAPGATLSSSSRAAAAAATTASRTRTTSTSRLPSSSTDAEPLAGQGQGLERRRPHPLEGLRPHGRPAPVDEDWSFALCRYDYSADFEGPELSTCAPLTQVNFHPLRGLRDAPLQGAGAGASGASGELARDRLARPAAALPRPPRASPSSRFPARSRSRTSPKPARCS